MTDYNDLITRLRSMDGIGDIQLNELMNRKTPMAAAAAIAELVSRVAELQSSLSEVVGDLEMRSHLKRGEDYGLVDVSNGVYMRAKHALGQLEGDAE